MSTAEITRKEMVSAKEIMEMVSGMLKDAGYTIEDNRTQTCLTVKGIVGEPDRDDQVLVSFREA